MDKTKSILEDNKRKERRWDDGEEVHRHNENEKMKDSLRRWRK